MAFLVYPLPPHPVYVKKEYLYDHQKGHGELTLASDFSQECSSESIIF